MEINPPNINPFKVRKKLGANEEGDRPFLTVIVVWMWSCMFYIKKYLQPSFFSPPPFLPPPPISIALRPEIIAISHYYSPEKYPQK